jgi:hypothetical protein
MLQQIPLIHGGDSFRLSHFTGALYSTPTSARTFDNPLFGNKSVKIKRAWAYCEDPYKFTPVAERCTTMSKTRGCEDYRRALVIANRVVKTCRRQFLHAWASALFRKPLFENSSDAIAFFRNEVDGDQTALCLPRAFFAAQTSMQFKDEGVVFIGVFLPSRSMHAWVIEGDAIADPDDDIWINYRPVAALA